jgi:Homogentisate 1,2-dioxygenase C-terminal
MVRTGGSRSQSTQPFSCQKRNVLFAEAAFRNLRQLSRACCNPIFGADRPVSRKRRPREAETPFECRLNGVYDAKPEGFVPGGFSLHNTMLPHGPDVDAFAQASNIELKPVKLTNTLAFMFETRFRQRVTQWAENLDSRQDDYADCWSGLEKKVRSQTARAEIGSRHEAGVSQSGPRWASFSRFVRSQTRNGRICGRFYPAISVRRLGSHLPQAGRSGRSA